MTRYINNADNLKLMMNMLKEKSRSIQFEAFHVFKVCFLTSFKGTEGDRLCGSLFIRFSIFAYGKDISPSSSSVLRFDFFGRRTNVNQIERDDSGVPRPRSFNRIPLLLLLQVPLILSLQDSGKKKKLFKKKETTS